MRLAFLVFLFLSLTFSSKGYPWGSFYMEFFSIAAALIFCFIGKNKKIILSKFTIFLLILIILIILSGAFVAEYKNIQTSFLGVIYIGLMFLVANESALQEEDFFFLILKIVLAASIFNFGVQLIQFFNISIHPALSIPLEGGRPYGNIGQPNNLGTLLSTAYAINFFFYKNKKINVFIYISISIMLIFGIALTDSRTAFVSLLAIGFYLLITRENRSLACKVMPITFLTLIFIKKSISEFSVQRLDIGAGFSSLRLEMWQLLLDAILIRPWLGYGFNQTVLAHFEVSDKHPVWWHQNIFQSHNFIIDFIVWFGIPIGLFISVFLLFLFFKKTIESLKNEKLQLPISLLLPLIVHSFFEYPLHYFYFILLLSVFSGRLINSKKLLPIKNLKIISIVLIAGGFKSEVQHPGFQ